MRLTRIAAATSAFAILSISSSLATSNAGNVTAQGSGSCSAITGTFPAFGAVNTVGGKTQYSVTLLITPSGGTPQTVTDTFTPSTGALASYDTQLFGITSGTYSGSISVNSFGVLVLGSTGTSSGTSVTLNTPISGAPACVIQLFGQLFFTG